MKATQSQAQNRNMHNLKSLRERRDSPSVQVKPFDLHDSDSNLAGKHFGVTRIDQQNILNALNVSGVERDDVSNDYNTGNPMSMEYVNSGQVNDEMIEDIQKRLQLLDEFK